MDEKRKPYSRRGSIRKRNIRNLRKAPQEPSEVKEKKPELKASPVLAVNLQDVPSTSKGVTGSTAVAFRPRPILYSDTETSSSSDAEQEDNEGNRESESERDISMEIQNTEPIPSVYELSGRRIVDVDYFFREMRVLNDHKPFSCNFNDMEFVEEKIDGLISSFTFRCKMCRLEKVISTESKSNKMDVNSATVLSAISTGRGHTEMVQEQAILNMPLLSHRKYMKHHDIISHTIYESMWNVMEEAGREERELALQIGDVDSEGNGLVTVIADGAWSKRSYKVNYDASSGVACIVGAKTKKVLFLATRNKYCAICARADSKNEQATQHICSKNWSSSSTAMESDIIVEGFKKSVQMHRLKYIRLVGDGDSSVSKKLNTHKPYGIRQLVQKVECSNHLLRNYCTRLRELAKTRLSSKKAIVSPQYRKRLSSNIERLRIGIKKAILYRMQQDVDIKTQITLLVEDINNCPMHVFGDHKKCAEYFCKGSSTNETNYVPDFNQCGLLDDIISCGNRLSQNAHSLILNMNNNAAETYNSVVAKFIGGKRINFSLKNSYDIRCKAAAISYNIKEQYFSSIHKVLTTKSPGRFTKQYIKRLNSRRKYRMNRKVLFPVSKNKTKKYNPPDEDYGATENVGDGDDNKNIAQNDFLLSLKKTLPEISELEEKTRGQSANPLWKQEKSFRLTASNFGMICKKRATTDSQKVANRLLEQGIINSAAVRWGLDHESIAKRDFEAKYKLVVRECGLYVSEEFPYLGASPDGIVNAECIVEIKCPYAASKSTPQEAIAEGKIKYLRCKDNGEYSLVKNHSYYYQVQGQLAITKFAYCYFIVWTPLGMLVDKIERDENFWKEKMVPKLSEFYLNFMLPEIIKKY